MQPAASLVQRMIDLAFNRGELGIVDELVAENGRGMPARRTGLKQLIAGLRQAFPDLHCTVEDEIGEDDKIAACWTMRGTHQGMFLGNPPSGKPVVVQGMIFVHTKNDQIVEDWTLVDQMSILRQLGIIPPL